MIHCFGTADEKLNVNAGIAALGHPIRTAARACRNPARRSAKSRPKAWNFSHCIGGGEMAAIVVELI